MATKEPDYEVARAYMEMAEWDVELATDRWFGDSEWEKTRAALRRDEAGED